MSIQKNDHYWQNKISVWLHDPVIKAFDIARHEEHAKRIAEALFQTFPAKEEYSPADMIASGLTRAALPGYNSDPAKNGSIDFAKNSCITHPLSAHSLKLDLPTVDSDKLTDEIIALLKNDIGLDKTYEELRTMTPADIPLNGLINKNTSPEDWAKGLFFYLYFAFQRRLRNENIGGLGGIWDILPADTRIPDHSIWSHLGLTSAIHSSMMAAENPNPKLAVFAITPVQEFIAKSRKLRDYWTSSVLLSYLAFTGITVVMDKLGPDHVVYPSLHNQSLVDAWLDKKYHLGKYLVEQDGSDFKKLQDDSKTIAAFPNKFVFITTQKDVGELCKEIQNAVQNEWLRVSGFVRDYLAPLETDCSTFKSIWNMQTEQYWTYSWASCDFIKLDDIKTVEKLLPKSKWKHELGAVKAFNDSANHLYNTARLYGTTHSLVQGLLVAGKTKPVNARSPQYGEKCPLCGEGEVLHNYRYDGIAPAKDYANSVKAFWDIIRHRTNGEEGFAQVAEHERLDAVCAVKRFLPVVLKKDKYKDEILAEALTLRESFPSTTEMAATDYIRKLTGSVSVTRKEYPQLVQALHESDSEEGGDESSKAIKELISEGKKQGIELTDKDKYYALLLMDGDKMGDLINGKTLSATWQHVIHPDLANRFEQDSFAPDSPFKRNGLLCEKRTINPAIHGTISDSLNSFARYSVQPVIKQHCGKLIYAGGDDVCAILPLNSALAAADAIRQSYIYSFANYTKMGALLLDGIVSASCGRIGLHLGSGSEGISLSGAIIIAHHKQPLKEVIQDAHVVLDSIAKEKSGRNSLAIRLKKRSGGDRDMWLKWDEKNIFSDDKETCLESFKKIVNLASSKELSASLLYKLENIRESLDPMTTDIASFKTHIIRIFEYEVAHSGMGVDNPYDIAVALAGICVKVRNRDWFNPEAAIIANYLASAIWKRSLKND